MKTVSLFENYKNRADGSRIVTQYTLSHVGSDCGNAVDYVLPAGFGADKLMGEIYGPAGSYCAIPHSSGRPQLVPANRLRLADGYAWPVLQRAKR